jgi:DNA-binding transcriptional regulator LsrR (DeoR family)
MEFAGSTRDLITRIAWLYYKEGLKESRIATMLRLSRSKVGRLLQKARGDGIVHFQVLGTTSNCLEIEKKLIDLFDLQDAVVVPTVSENKIKESLARAAAQYLERHLTSGDLFAVGWGITISEVPEFIRSPEIHDLRIVTLNGGLTPSFYLNPYDVGSRLAYIFGGQCYYVHAPAITTSEDLCRSLKADTTVQQALEMAKHADYSMVGIGRAGAESTLVKMRYLNLGETEALRQQGAVGDILAQFFNVQGEKVDCDLHKRIVAFPIEDLSKMKNVIGLAGGTNKVQAILGALHGRYIKILITDEETTKTVIDLEQKPAF